MAGPLRDAAAARRPLPPAAPLAPQAAADLPQHFERTAPNQLWQLDFSGPLEVARQKISPFTVLDDHSRYLLALR